MSGNKTESKKSSSSNTNGTETTSSKFDILPVLGTVLVLLLTIFTTCSIITEKEISPRLYSKTIATTASLLVSCLKTHKANRVARALSPHTRGDFGAKAMVAVGAVLIAVGVQLAVFPPALAVKAAPRVLMTVLSTITDGLVLRPVWMAVAALRTAVDVEKTLVNQRKRKDAQINTVGGRWAVKVRQSFKPTGTSTSDTEPSFDPVSYEISSKTAAEMQRQCAIAVYATGWLFPIVSALSLWIRLVLTTLGLFMSDTKYVLADLCWTVSDLVRLVLLGWPYWLVERSEQDLRRAAIVSGDRRLCIQLSLSPSVADNLHVGNGVVVAVISGLITVLTVILPLPIVSLL